MDEKTNSTALALLLLAKMIAKAGNVKLSKDDKMAFAQIAHIAGNNLPAFAELLEGIK